MRLYDYQVGEQPGTPSLVFSDCESSVRLPGGFYISSVDAMSPSITMKIPRM